MTPRVKQLLKRMAPVAMGSGVHQFNVLIGTLIASVLPVGGISYLYYAERLNQLPLSVIGTAMSTVLLPMLAKSIRAGNHEEAKDLQSQGIEISMLFTVPAMIGLVFLAECAEFWYIGSHENAFSHPIPSADACGANRCGEAPDHQRRSVAELYLFHPSGYQRVPLVRNEGWAEPV